ncbi:MAG: hypothetical protein A3H45_13335 [Ignavibacteria bacterium RIFCSPLOWO2_02_FULL_55_14]|nr:MAG: hypothetical protein A3H45_13335 [Ignavibacteria bacterium RIFCSPLOWO2_02_FULL_55_14]
MQEHNLTKTLLAGIIATVAMTVLTFVAPMMGMPEMDIPRMLSSFMGMPVVAGWLAHFMIGTGFAVAYAYILVSRIPGSPFVKGAMFGLVPWVLAQVMVNPIMGAGVFALSTPAPMLMVVGSLMGHVVYGGVLGAVYGSSGLKKSIPVPQHN